EHPARRLLDPAVLMSLRKRLLLGLLCIATVLVVTNGVLSRTFESFLLDREDRQLVGVASRPFFRGGRGLPLGGDQALSEYFIAYGDPDSGSLVRLSSAFADQDQP